MCDSPTTLIKFVCICINYLSVNHQYLGSKNLESSIKFLINLIVSYDAKGVSRTIQTSDSLRKLYFTVVSRLVFTTTQIVEEPKTQPTDEFFLHTKETSSEKRDYSMYVTNQLLFDLMILDVPQLQLEFF